jgi:single-stranded DNA-binding protein
MSLNKATIVGKVIASPDSRVTNSDEPVVRVDVQTGTNTKIRLVCYKSTADKASALKSGDRVLASGSLIIPAYKAPDGSIKKDPVELSVRDLFAIEGSIENLSSYVPGQTPNKPPASKAPTKSSKEDLSDVLLEDEIPF